MAMNGVSTDQLVSGIVRSVNDKGLKLEGYDSWFNISKFAVGVVLPERGASVVCTLDKSGFLRCVAASDGSELSPAQRSAPLDSQARSGHWPERSSGHDRDRTITRLAVLKAAAEFGAARPQLKSGDVLAIAATWERWINREEETTYDLVDAF
jgi:hypothetical protein